MAPVCAISLILIAIPAYSTGNVAGKLDLLAAIDPMLLQRLVEPFVLVLVQSIELKHVRVKANHFCAHGVNHFEREAALGKTQPRYTRFDALAALKPCFGLMLGIERWVAPEALGELGDEPHPQILQTDAATHQQCIQFHNVVGPQIEIAGLDVCIHVALPCSMHTKKCKQIPTENLLGRGRDELVPKVNVTVNLGRSYRLKILIRSIELGNHWRLVSHHCRIILSEKPRKSTPDIVAMKNPAEAGFLDCSVRTGLSAQSCRARLAHARAVPSRRVGA